MEMTELLIEHPAPGVQLLRLNRPHALNALSRDLLAQLGAAIAAAERDTETGAVVLTGNARDG